MKFIKKLSSYKHRFHILEKPLLFCNFLQSHLHFIPSNIPGPFLKFYIFYFKTSFHCIAKLHKLCSNLQLLCLSPLECWDYKYLQVYLAFIYLCFFCTLIFLWLLYLDYLLYFWCCFSDVFVTWCVWHSSVQLLFACSLMFLLEDL